MSYTVIFICENPSSYIVGESDRPIAHGEEYMTLKGAARMHIAGGRVIIDPIVTCDEMTLSLRHFVGVGYLKDDFKREYDAWRTAYQNHAAMFADEPSDQTELFDTVG